MALLELCCLLLRQRLSREELKATLLEPSFATKFAAGCAVEAETFPEALLEELTEQAKRAEGDYDIKVGGAEVPVWVL